MMESAGPVARVKTSIGTVVVPNTSLYYICKDSAIPIEELSNAIDYKVNLIVDYVATEASSPSSLYLLDNDTIILSHIVSMCPRDFRKVANTVYGKFKRTMGALTSEENTRIRFVAHMLPALIQETLNTEGGGVKDVYRMRYLPFLSPDDIEALISVMQLVCAKQPVYDDANVYSLLAKRIRFDLDTCGEGDDDDDDEDMQTRLRGALEVICESK